MGSAGPGLRSQGSSNKGMLSRCARGDGVIASSARYGPIPLPPVVPRQVRPLTVLQTTVDQANSCSAKWPCSDVWTIVELSPAIPRNRILHLHRGIQN
jgi:hypothetical protein